MTRPLANDAVDYGAVRGVEASTRSPTCNREAGLVRPSASKMGMVASIHPRRAV